MVEGAMVRVWGGHARALHAWLELCLKMGTPASVLMLAASSSCTLSCGGRSVSVGLLSMYCLVEKTKL